MPNVILIDSGGIEHRLEATAGEPLMHALRDAGFVEAICGGGMSCGTCAVALDGASAGAMAPADAMEQALLEGLGCDAQTQRLSCQLNVTPAMEGLRLRVLETA